MKRGPLKRAGRQAKTHREDARGHGVSGRHSSPTGGPSVQGVCFGDGPKVLPLALHLHPVLGMGLLGSVSM